MLEKLHYDALCLIAQHITNPKDYLSVYLTCHNTYNFIKNHCTDITLVLYYNSSIIFLREMRGLKNIYIFRSYKNMLDFTPIHSNINLLTLFVNSLVNTLNVPKNVIVLHSYDKLPNYKPHPCIKNTRRDKNLDEEEVYLSPKEYFIMRYNMKRSSKIKFKEISSI